MPNSARPATSIVKRSPGRPRNEWAKCLYDKVKVCFPSEQHLLEAIMDEHLHRAWTTFTSSLDNIYSSLDNIYINV
eukprot:6791596-Pyramimonas_sp.AAC.1